MRTTQNGYAMDIEHTAPESQIKSQPEIIEEEKCGSETLLQDLAQTRQYLYALAGDSKAAFNWTAIQQKPGSIDLGKTLDKYGSLEELKQWLIAMNVTGYSIFVTVNETDGKGRKEANVAHVRAVWNDCDHGLPDSYPLEPSFRVHSSPGKIHDYWLLDDEMSFEQHTAAIDHLVKNYLGDKGAKGLPRILRVPGFLYWKYGSPQLVTLETKSGEGYTAEQIVNAFPPLAKDRSHKRKTAKNTAVSIDVLPATLTQISKQQNLEEVAEALSHADADDREIWICYGHALKRDFQEEGFTVWDEWSATSKLYNEQDSKRRWDGFDVSATGPDRITCGTIIKRAREARAIELASTPLATHDDTDVLMEELAEDKKPILTRGDLQDPKSLKNVAIFLLSEQIMPWCNEFDNNYYLRDASNKDIRLSDISLRDLEMRMYRKGLRVSTDFCEKAVTWLGDKRTAHPVRHYLNGLEWDGTPRLDTMLHTYVGADDTDHNRLVGSKWMIAAVRRVRRPGCKFDTTLVLDGPQNAGKSSFFRTLAGDDLFTDGVNIGDGSKETIELTSGSWIVETAELSGLNGRDVAQVKQALSKQTDKARLAYGRFTTAVKRQFVFCGTTNDAAYLRDKTGNRRFWCVSVGKIDLDGLRRKGIRDQLWAEAAHREKQGEHIYLTGTEYALAAAEQAKREEDDPLEMQIEELLSKFKYGRLWKTDLYKLLGYSDLAKASGMSGKRIRAIMARLGWKDGRVRDGGTQRGCFSKDPTVEDGCEAPPPQRALGLRKTDDGFTLH